MSRSGTNTRAHRQRNEVPGPVPGAGEFDKFLPLIDASVSPTEISAGRSPSKITAGAAGFGSGTLLVLIANNLPSGHPWKPWLVLLAPSVSIAVSVIYEWARAATHQHFRKRELNAIVERAKQSLQEALHNPSTSPDHRQQLTKKLEQLELHLVQADLETIKSMRLYH